jgi:hypothetical protein
MSRPREVHLEDLLGRRVRALNGRPVGHIEEVRATSVAGVWRISAYLLGAGALRERFSLVRSAVGRARTIVVRWDQMDLSDPSSPRLTCPVDDLAIEE